MSSTTETGHAKNVANFDTLTTTVTAFGAVYNPSNPALKPGALQTQATSAHTAMTAVNSVFPAYSNAVALREAAFEPLSKLTTRIGNAFKASGVIPQVVDSALTIIRKIQGKRASSRTTALGKKAATAVTANQIVEVSASQMSYDNRLENLDKLIQLLASNPLYAPNEIDLKVDSLTALHADLKSKNAAVKDAAVPLTNARIARDEILYKPGTGLVDTAADVKTYLKSLFGASSPQFKSVSRLAFKTIG